MGGGGTAPPFLILALGGSGQLHALTTLTPGKEPLLTNWIGDWVGPAAGLNAVE